MDTTGVASMFRQRHCTEYLQSLSGTAIKRIRIKRKQYYSPLQKEYTVTTGCVGYLPTGHHPITHR